MTSTSIYHYVYRISNLSTRKHYYGVRSCKVEPKFDLGVKYFSSSTDVDFIHDQKTNPQNFRYKVVRLFITRQEAMDFEIILHEKFEVSSNENFYNRANATSSGFGMSGTHFSAEHKEKLSRSTRDSTIYTFYYKDGSTFCGTQRDFRIKFNIVQSNVNRLVNGKLNCVQGWFISVDMFHKSVFKFQHTNGEEFIGTQIDFTRKFSLNSGNVNSLVRGARKSLAGWKARTHFFADIS